MLGQGFYPLYVQAPVGSVRESVLATLLPLAQAQQFSAIRTLAQILSFELGGSVEIAMLPEPCGPIELLEIGYVPEAVRIYSLAFAPRDFVAHIHRIQKIASEVDLALLLKTLQKLILRGSPLQHEALKAFVLSIFARTAAEEVPSYPAGAISILNDICTKCCIRSGASADSEFTFGAELLTQCQDHLYLVYIVLHEFGHTWRHILESPPEAEHNFLDKVLDDIPTILNMLDLASWSGSDPLRQGDLRGRELSSGLKVLCTHQSIRGYGYTHISLSRIGAPIDFNFAAVLAHLLLQVIGVDIATAAIVHSRNGYFHLGFPGVAPPSSALHERLGHINLSRLANDSRVSSQDWVKLLVSSDRFGCDERDMPLLLRITRDNARFYGLNQNTGMSDHRVCSEAARISDLSLVEANKRLEFLHAGVRCCKPGIIRRLLASGVSARLPIKELGYSIGAVVSHKEAIYAGPSPAEVFEVLEALLGGEIEIDDPFDDTKSTQLMRACVTSAHMTRYVLSLGANVHLWDATGRTPLMLAVMGGDPEVVTAVLDAHGSPKSRDFKGNTPLHIAVSMDDLKITNLLLEQGASPNLADNAGKTPLMLARSASIVRRILEAGGDVNATTATGETALMLASLNGRIESMKALIASGVDVKAATDIGMTSVHYACKQVESSVRLYGWVSTETRVACIQLLLDSGGTIDVRSNAGETPLMTAISANERDLACWLIHAGADVRAIDRDGNTALHVALTGSHYGIEPLIQELLQAGADIYLTNRRGESSLDLVGNSDRGESIRNLLQDRDRQARQDER